MPSLLPNQNNPGIYSLCENYTGFLVTLLPGSAFSVLCPFKHNKGCRGCQWQGHVVDFDSKKTRRQHFADLEQVSVFIPNPKLVSSAAAHCSTGFSYFFNFYFFFYKGLHGQGLHQHVQTQLKAQRCLPTQLNV